jgi:hypothetical protein
MGALIVVLILIALYFVPTFIAAMRHHHNVIAIGALNFLLGWSFIGWVAAFVWALTSPSSPGPPVIVNTGAGSAALPSPSPSPAPAPSPTPTLPTGEQSFPPKFDAVTGRPIIGYDTQTGDPILGDRES